MKALRVVLMGGSIAAILAGFVFGLETRQVARSSAQVQPVTHSAIVAAR